MSFTVSPPVTGTISLYKYEPFSYTITFPVVSSNIVTTTGTSSFISSFLTVTTSNATFASASGFNASSSALEPLVITVDSNYVFSNNVTIGNGRFFPPSSNQAFTFYQNEPVSTTFGSNIQFTSAASLVNVYSSPALPSGLYFSNYDSYNFYLQGTPTAQYPSSNYLIIGQNLNTGKVVTVPLTFQVKGERITVDVSSYSATLDIGIPISSQYFTATFPTYGLYGFSFLWSNALPDGLYFTDNAGTHLGSNVFSYTPSAPPFRIGIGGTPTINAASNYAAAGVSISNITVTARQTRGTNTLTAPIAITLPFAETVLFRNINVPTLYKNAIIPYQTKIFDVATYFSNTTSPIGLIPTSIESGTLTLSNYSSSNYSLVGTPVNVASNTYLFTATNNHGKTRTLSLAFPIIQDTVSFDYTVTPSNEKSYSFILSRPLSNALTSYYPYPITFRATSSSGNAITYSASAISNYGLTLNRFGHFLEGTPTRVNLAGQLITITASAANTNAINTTTLYGVFLDDALLTSNVPNISNLLQNSAMTPVQITGTTLSGRPIINYFAASALPTGLSISINGLISGTPTVSGSGTLSLSATTGYKTFSLSEPYNIAKDSIVFSTTTPYEVLYPGSNLIPINFTTLAYSGLPVFNYTFSNVAGPNYGLQIVSSSTSNVVIGGTLFSGQPPSQLLPDTPALFRLTGTAGNFTDQSFATLTVNNPIISRSYIADNPTSTISIPGNLYNYAFLPYSDNSSNYRWKTINTASSAANIQYSDIQFGFDIGSTLPLYYAVGNDSNSVSYGSGKILYSYGTNWSISPIIGPNFTPVYSIVNIPSYNNQWITAGVFLSTAYFFTSLDSQRIFKPIGNTIPLFYPRDDSNATDSYYLKNGIAFRTAKDNLGRDVLMIGGKYNGTFSMKRSIDHCTTWSNVVGDFTKEVAYFSFDGPLWIATGSDGHETGTNINTNPTKTIRFSVDYGQHWSYVTSTEAFNLNAYDILYSSNAGAYLSTGVSYDSFTGTFIAGLASSLDGVNWLSVNNAPFTDTISSTTPLVPNIGIGPLDFDTNTNTWKVFVRTPYYDGVNSNVCLTVFTHDISTDYTTNWTNTLIWASTSTYTTYSVVVYSNVFYYSTALNNINHPPSTSPTFWTAVPNYTAGFYPMNSIVKIVYGKFTEVYIASPLSGTSQDPLYPDYGAKEWDKVVYGGDRQLTSFTAPAYISTGITDASITFSSSVYSGAPTITSPTVQQYSFYEYVPITPIVVNATGTGTIYLFTSKLPQGLSFNPISKVITGIPTKLYQGYVVTVYAKDDNGIASISLSINVLTPFIINPQNGASSYTALVRHSVEVNAAQNAINNEVYPDQTRELGTMMSPAAPDTTKHPPCGC